MGREPCVKKLQGFIEPLRPFALAPTNISRSRTVWFPQRHQWLWISRTSAQLQNMHRSLQALSGGIFVDYDLSVIFKLHSRTLDRRANEMLQRTSGAAASWNPPELQQVIDPTSDRLTRREIASQHGWLLVRRMHCLRAMKKSSRTIINTGRKLVVVKIALFIQFLFWIHALAKRFQNIHFLVWVSI